MKEKKLFVRAAWLGAATAVLALVFVGGSVMLPSREATGGWVYVKEQPNLVVSPTVVPFKRKVKVMIAGSGFEPEQEIGLHINMGGVPSDISFLVEPRPTPNEHGAFFAEWTLDREIRAKLLEPTAYTVEAVDDGGNLLAHAPLALMQEKEAKK